MSEEITNENEEIQVTAEELEDLMAAAHADIEEAEHPGGIEMTEWAFSNDKTNKHILQMFHMFYNAVFANKLGVMHARVKGTEDEIHTILVGIEVREDGSVVTYPLAKVFDAAEQSKYEAPTGDGNYTSG